MQALIIYKGEHKVEETSSHKIPTQKLKFNSSKQKQSDPSYDSISDNKESTEFQVLHYTLAYLFRNINLYFQSVQIKSYKYRFIFYNVWKL